MNPVALSTLGEYIQRLLFQQKGLPETPARVSIIRVLNSSIRSHRLDIHMDNNQNQDQTRNISSNTRQNGQLHLDYPPVSRIVSGARKLALQIYNDTWNLANALMELYDDATWLILDRTEDPQNILDHLVGAELLTINAWNDHRLGAEVPAWAQSPPDYDASEAPYDRDGNIPDTFNYFPTRLSAMVIGVAFTDPGRMEPNKTLRKPYREYRQFLDAHQGNGVQIEPMELGLAPTRSQVETASNPTNLVQKMPNKKRKRSTKNPEMSQYNTLKDAPHQNMPFPEGNITVSEILAFFPEWLKSVDVANRFISNGGKAAVIQKMINEYRAMPRGKIINNAVLRMMQRNMRARTEVDTPDWNIGNHQAPKGWDETKVSVSGFRTPVEVERKKCKQFNSIPSPIPFKYLALNLKYLPDEYPGESLDLTRCIRYHLEHPNLNLKFPTDFANLVQQLGGPTPVQPENYDNAIFSRWNVREVKKDDAKHNNQVGKKHKLAVLKNGWGKQQVRNGEGNDWDSATNFDEEEEQEDVLRPSKIQKVENLTGSKMGTDQQLPQVQSRMTRSQDNQQAIQRGFEKSYENVLASSLVSIVPHFGNTRGPQGSHGRVDEWVIDPVLLNIDRQNAEPNNDPIDPGLKLVSQWSSQQS